jgi:hypothetical protein
MDKTGPGSCPLAGFVMSCVETSDSATRVSPCVTFFKYHDISLRQTPGTVCTVSTSQPEYLLHDVIFTIP